jgi:N-acetyl sugar amidotransferase
MSSNQMSSLKKSPYRQCTRCVMDTTADEISFDSNGICNFCTEFLERSSHVIHEDAIAKQSRLEQLLEAVRNTGKGKPYDCVVGVSGGVDSSWVLFQAKLLGLRPIAVHMDNGWNSELAQSNIANLVNGLGVDLYTHVIEWDEYKGLMQSFFDADVIDVELLYDNAMLAVCYRQAKRLGIKYILSGSNQVTEGMRMPNGWNWYKRDVINIKALAKRFGDIKIKTFPTHSTLDLVFDEVVRGVRWISFLDYLHYNKSAALDELEQKYGYKRYPYKHYESIFTRFYQGYILPIKFGVDKRILHLSTLVASGQMTREDALEGLTGIPYSSRQDLDDDIQYFLKKMGWSHESLAEYLVRAKVCHDFFPSEARMYKQLVGLLSPRAKKRVMKILGR